MARRGTGIALIGVVVSLGAAAPALGAGLSYVGEVTGNGQRETRSVAISPDGQSLYAGSAGTLSAFAVGPNGALTPQGCIGDTTYPNPACSTSADALNVVSYIAISPSGEFVYARSEGAIAVLERSSDGSLDPLGCIGEPDRPTTSGCADDLEHIGSGAIAMSPDGLSLYSVGHHGLRAFDVDPQTGLLTHRECVAASGMPPHHGSPPSGCDRSDPGLFSARGLVVSPDGTSIYAWSNQGNEGHGANAIVRVDTDPASGEITGTECLFGLPAGCGPVPYTAADPFQLKISPDGLSVYLTGGYFANNGGLYAFRRDPGTGDLAYLGCVGTEPTPCEPAPWIELAGGLAISPDGRTVLTTSSRTLVAYDRRSPDVVPMPTRCLGDRPGCSGPIPTVVALTFGAGGYVYGGGGADDAVRIFRCDPGCGESPPDPGPPEPGAEEPRAQAPPDTAIRAKARRRGHRLTAHLSSSVPGARFECAVDREPFTPCGAKTVLRGLERGRHRLAAHAIDDAGNVDPEPAVYRWRAKRLPG